MQLKTFKYQILPIKDKLFRFAKRIVQNSEIAKDIVQEVLVKVWQYEGEIQNAEAWCMRTTRNLSLDKLKSKHHKVIDIQLVSESFTQAQPSPYQSTEQSDQLRSVHKVIATLPESQRMVIQLRDVEGYTYQEIATVLNCSVDIVKVNLFRARKKVKTQLLKMENYGC